MFAVRARFILFSSRPLALLSVHHFNINKYYAYFGAIMSTPLHIHVYFIAIVQLFCLCYCLSLRFMHYILPPQIVTWCIFVVHIARISSNSHYLFYEWKFACHVAPASACHLDKCFIERKKKKFPFPIFFLSFGIFFFYDGSLGFMKLYNR